MNQFTKILAFMLVLAMSAGIAASQQVEMNENMLTGDMPLPEMENFTKLEISPQNNFFMMKVGESKEMTVTVRNKEEKTVSVNPRTVLAPYGGYNVDPDWFTITPQNAQIPAGESQKFTIKVSVPDDASIGGSGVQIAFTD